MPPPPEKSGSRMPLIVVILLMLGGGGAWFVTQNGTPPTSAASNVNASSIDQPRRQAPRDYKSITERVEDTLDEVEPIPLDPLGEDDAEPELRVIPPSDAEIRALEQRAKAPGVVAPGGYTPPPPGDAGGAGGGAVSSSANSPGENYQIGQTFARQGKWSQAVQAYGSAAQGEPSNAEYQCAYGEALYHSGQRNAAEGPLMRANSVPRAYRYLGYIAQGNGDIAGARGYWQSYLGYNPPDAGAIQAELDRLN